MINNKSKMKFLKTAAVFLLCVLASRHAFALNDLAPGVSRLVLGGFLIFSGKEADREQMLASNFNAPGFRPYNGERLANSPGGDNYHVFKTFFTVSDGFIDKNLTLYVSHFAMPVIISVNGVVVYQKGLRPETDGVYSAGNRSVLSVPLSRGLIDYNTEKLLVIEVFPQYETNSLPELSIAEYSYNIFKVFIQNLLLVYLVIFAMLLALLVAVYHFSLFISRGGKEFNYLLFSLFSFSFALAYTNIGVPFDTVHYSMIIKITRCFQLLCAGFFLLFILEMSGLLAKQKKYITAGVIIYSAICAAYITFQRDLSSVNTAFSVISALYLAPVLLTSITLMTVSIAVKKKLNLMPVLASALFVVAASLRDMILLGGAVQPLFWFAPYAYLSLVIVIFGILVREAGRLAALEIAKKEADEANESKSRFLAAMSHELRAPLNAVIGFSEIELRNKHLEPSRQNIARIRRSGSYILEIVNDLLDIQKIETGKFDLAFEEYDTASLVGSVAGQNKVRFGGKPVEFVLEIDGGTPAKLIGDELRIKQVLNNLLSNAVKFTDKGFVTLAVGYKNFYEPDEPPQTKQKTEICFRVSDTGAGIRKEDMEKLFEEYAQFDARPHKKIEGTGLGLPIARKLARAMGGDVEAESVYGVGSCFTARVVQTRSGDETIGEEAAAALRSAGNGDWGEEADEERNGAGQRPPSPLPVPGCPILLADDKPMNLLVLRGLLEPYGFQIDTASSGREAVEKTKEKHYGMIFMDHLMPGTDGVEAMKAIREDGRYAKTPVVAVTSNALRGMREFYIEQGFDGYISKPVMPQMLDEVIRELLAANGERYVQTAAVLHAAVMEEKLDKLNHMRFAFESGRTIDPDYFKRFAALVESLDGLPGPLREQAASLAGAGRRGDEAAARDLLPGFCGNLQSYLAENENASEDCGVREMVLEIKKAVLENETAAAEKIMAELKLRKLSVSWRKHYFSLYDALMSDDAEKALGVIKTWEGLYGQD